MSGIPIVHHDYHPVGCYCPSELILLRNSSRRSVRHEGKLKRRVPVQEDVPCEMRMGLRIARQTRGVWRPVQVGHACDVGAGGV
jgi:hypothetical protein